MFCSWFPIQIASLSPTALTDSYLFVFTTPYTWAVFSILAYDDQHIVIVFSFFVNWTSIMGIYEEHLTIPVNPCPLAITIISARCWKWKLLHVQKDRIEPRIRVWRPGYSTAHFIGKKRKPKKSKTQENYPSDFVPNRITPSWYFHRGLDSHSASPDVVILVLQPPAQLSVYISAVPCSRAGLSRESESYRSRRRWRRTCRRHCL